VNRNRKSSQRLWKLDASNPSKRKQSRHGCEIKSKSRSLKQSNEAQEPCAVKVARTVPWGGKRRKASTYPDRYPRDVTEEEWGQLAALIPPARRGGCQRTVNIRAVLNGLL